ncbi:hypothetical protein [Nocardia sp. NPDC051750]|uniref:hypothetical protein n=1 Tax=Nocardia sp. NPDC051750 TaxID=3364325 RepID=UPI00379341DC
MLERQVYNLPLTLAAAVVAPMTFHNMTLPLASWAGLIDKPIDESTRSEVTAAVDDLKRAAESGKNAVTTLIDHITRAFRGFDFAADIFSAYLDNNGSDFVYEISPSNVERVIATSGARDQVAKCLETIKDQARRDPQTGVTRELTSPWLGAEPEEGDIGYALGHYDVAVGSDPTVYSEDGGLRAEIIYRIYIYEFYNFDHKKLDTFRLNIGTNINNEMRELEEFGWARSFRVHGEAPRLERWIGNL